MASNKLDLALDDIVKQNKKSKGGRGGGRGGLRGGRGGNRGGGRGGGIKRLNSQSPMKGRGSMGGGKWKHDLANGGAGSPPPTGPVRLNVGNLDFGVNDADVKELFSRCGNIVKASVHYAANGRSQGTAEVVYRNYREAVAAVKEYNGRQLDGRAMKVEIVSAIKPGNLASRMGSRGGMGGKKRFGGQVRGRGSGGKRGGRGRGRGGRGAPPNKDDLDKQMDEYRMQTDTA